MYEESSFSAPAGARVAVFGTLPSSACEKVEVRSVLQDADVPHVISNIELARARLSFCLFQCLNGRYRMEAAAHELVLAPGILYAMGPQAAKGLRETSPGSFLLGVAIEPAERARFDGLGKGFEFVGGGVKAVEPDVAAQSAAVAVGRAAGVGEPEGSQEELAAHWLRSAIRLLDPGYASRIRTEAHGVLTAVSAEEEAFHKAQVYMRRRFSERLLIDEVASKVGLSSRHLGRIFRRAADTTPGRWLTEFRLSRARAMLEGGEEACVKAVAYNCGFSSPSYFANCYKRRFGELPSEHHVWRRDE